MRHPSTHAFLDRALAANADAAQLRLAVRTLMPLLASVRGRAAESQTDLHLASEDESDPLVHGKFYEARSQLKALDQLAGKATDVLQELVSHLDNSRRHLNVIHVAAAAPAQQESTEPGVAP